MMKMSKLLGLLSLGAAMAIGPAAASADDDAPAARPTFYKDVLPVMQQNCQDCHRPSGLNLGGMIAPMPLMTYEDVRPWAKSIATVVSDREMPPWHASEDFHGVFENERVLNDEQIATIVRWAETGAAAGNPEDAPEPITWPEEEWAIGEPDLILTLDEPFLVEDDVEDLNINLTTDIPMDKLPEDKYITAVEFKPGSDIVHHIIGFSVPPRTADTTGLQMIGGIAQGSQPTQLPDGYGIKLHAGGKFVFQMHYHKEPGPGTAKYDQSQVAFRFADKPVNRVYLVAVGNPAEMYVPAGEKVKIPGTKDVTRDIEIISLLPHMHLRGDYAKYIVQYPDGKEETLLEVPEYDFNWQTGYKFKEKKQIPAGSKITAIMGFDNTPEKESNPDPTIDVKWGPATTDEMNLGWMTFAYVNPDGTEPVPDPITREVEPL